MSVAKQNNENPSTHLHWFHVQYFCDAPLHDQKVGIVDVHLHRTKQIHNLLLQHRFAIDEVFVFAAAANTDLTRNGYFFATFVTNWTVVCISVVKHNGYRCFCDAGLTIFVHQFLQRARPNLLVLFVNGLPLFVK